MVTALTNRNVVFVGGLPRTGGSLLPFMFDGIPGVCTPPFEVHIAGPTGGQVSESDLAQQDPSRVVALTSRLKVLNKEKYPPKPITCKTGDRFTFDSVRYFEEYRDVVARGEVTATNYMALKLGAFFSAIDRPLPAHTRWLIAHSGKAMAYDSFHFLSTNQVGLYIYTRRGDGAWWRSYVGKFPKITMLKERKMVEQFLEVKRECDELAEHYARRFGDQYMILDYEELVDSPERAVAGICDRLGVEAPPSHDYRPTFLGIPVPANSSFKALRKQTGILSSATPRPEALDEASRELVDSLCATAPARTVPYAELSDLEFHEAARRVHRHFYVLESFRKQLSKAERLARKARQEKAAQPPAR